MHSCAAITVLVQQDNVTVPEPLQHYKVTCHCLRAALWYLSGHSSDIIKCFETENYLFSVRQFLNRGHPSTIQTKRQNFSNPVRSFWSEFISYSVWHCGHIAYNRSAIASSDIFQSTLSYSVLKQRVDNFSNFQIWNLGKPFTTHECNSHQKY